MNIWCLTELKHFCLLFQIPELATQFLICQTLESFCVDYSLKTTIPWILPAFLIVRPIEMIREENDKNSQKVAQHGIYKTKMK